MKVNTILIRHATEQTSTRKRIMAEGAEVGELEKFHGAQHGWKVWAGRGISKKFLGEFPSEEAAINACLVKIISPAPAGRW